MGETTVQKHLSNFIFNIDTGFVFFSSQINELHMRVLFIDELVAAIKENHAAYHNKCDAFYEMIRKTYFSVTRKNVRLPFKQTVECGKCLATVDLLKTVRTRRPIPATYSNSRWQMDLKKMPPARGYNYICNIVDYYSIFAFGACLKQKNGERWCRT